MKYLSSELLIILFRVAQTSSKEQMATSDINIQVFTKVEI